MAASRGVSAGIVAKTVLRVTTAKLTWQSVAALDEAALLPVMAEEPAAGDATRASWWREGLHRLRREGAAHRRPRDWRSYPRRALRRGARREPDLRGGDAHAARRRLDIEPCAGARVLRRRPGSEWCPISRSERFEARRYEPGIQRTYEELAAHYGTTIIRRPPTPRDTANLEVAVQVAECSIVAPLRNQVHEPLVARLRVPSDPEHARSTIAEHSFRRSPTRFDGSRTRIPNEAEHR